MDPIFEHRLTRLWIKLAERYKDNPVVAGYDLLNEPLPENTGAAEKYKHLAEPMYKRLTAEIRKIDKKHMIILEGVNWSNDWSIFTEPFDDNLVYQFHYYCWNNPDHLNDISHYVKDRERLNAPVWVGETGERNPSIYFGTTQYFEKNNIGWAYWPWKKIDNRQVIYSINAPDGYEKIIDYSRRGEKPSKELAEQVLTQLLENMKVENCEFLEHITQSMLRQIPARIYAVNYGHDGPGISYSVKDTTFAQFYRTSEPVKTVLLRESTRRQRSPSSQAIQLTEGEWTKYTAFATEEFSATIRLKVKSTTSESELSVNVNGQTRNFNLPDTAWTDLVIDELEIIKGENSFMTEVISGDIILLHFDVEKK
jgi:hypothetical protein